MSLLCRHLHTVKTIRLKVYNGYRYFKIYGYFGKYISVCGSLISVFASRLGDHSKRSTSSSNTTQPYGNAKCCSFCASISFFQMLQNLVKLIFWLFCLSDVFGNQIPLKSIFTNAQCMPGQEASERNAWLGMAVWFVYKCHGMDFY